jgi:hypothetical protein
VLSLTLVVSKLLRPEDRATGSPYLTFLAKRLPAAGLVPKPSQPSSGKHPDARVFLGASASPKCRFLGRLMHKR